MKTVSFNNKIYAVDGHNFLIDPENWDTDDIYHYVT